MFKKFCRLIKETIQEEYKYIIFLSLLYIIFQIPVNYYITIGGGTSNVESRIKVEDAYKSKGSFNISYVSQLEGTLLTYALSYVVPTWERESANNYKYTTEESIEDIAFRSDLDLKTANATATYWAYHLAGKEIEEIESKIYVISVAPDKKTALKVKDEIIAIDGNAYKKIEEYKDYLQTKRENEEVTITVKRNKKEKNITTKLYKEKDKILLGVILQYEKVYKTDPTVSIQFKKSESGPSGGLITTLEIYNQLTKKDITKGNKIAGTGTIEMDGSIGEIGGIEHKILGASKDKIDYFLVPSGQNYKDAVQYKKDKKLKIKLIEVKSIQDALQKLEELQ